MKIKAINLNSKDYVYFFGEAENLRLDLFKKIPNFNETMLLDFYELEAFNLLKSTEIYETDSIARTLQNELYLHNDILLSFLGQFYLANFMDTNICYKIENQNKSTTKRYEEWILLRDNLFHNLQKFIANSNEYIMNSNPETIAYWEAGSLWCHYNTYIFITEAGKRYYDNHLIPRLYDKYKNVEVEKI